ncbi:MAG TPA: AraC family transcriptional regulator, partial [Ferruginibacter sp.]|nr:AraC family transcriptional regulator [Ferruginibacter sp.]
HKFGLLFNSFASDNDLLKQQELFFDCMYQLLQPPAIDYVTVPKKEQRVALIIEFIRAHYKENISLQQLADLARLNPFHLVRLFKKSIGLSPYDYLLIVRAEEAKQLLRKGSMVQDAASATGFYDSSHFNRVFCKIAATSPKSFRSSKSQYRTSFTV